MVSEWQTLSVSPFAEALRMIPAGERYDFAQQLFVDMLQKGKKLYAFEEKGYWCDIGDIPTYMRASRDVQGLVQCNISGEKTKTGTSYRVRCRRAVPSCRPYISGRSHASEHVRIESGSVIDRRTVVGRRSRVTSSVLLPGARVGERSCLTGALVCAGGTVKKRRLDVRRLGSGEGSVLGTRAQLKRWCGSGHRRSSRTG